MILLSAVLAALVIALIACMTSSWLVLAFVPVPLILYGLWRGIWYAARQAPVWQARLNTWWQVWWAAHKMDAARAGLIAGIVLTSIALIVCLTTKIMPCAGCATVPVVTSNGRSAIVTVPAQVEEKLMKENLPSQPLFSTELVNITENTPHCMPAKAYDTVTVSLKYNEPQYYCVPPEWNLRELLPVQQHTKSEGMMVANEDRIWQIASKVPGEVIQARYVYIPCSQMDTPCGW